MTHKYPKTLALIDNLFYNKCNFTGIRIPIALFVLCYLVQYYLSLVLQQMYPTVDIPKSFFNHFVIQIGGGILIPLFGFLHYKSFFENNINATGSWNGLFFNCNLKRNGLLELIINVICVVMTIFVSIVLLKYQHNTFKTHGNSVDYLDSRITFVGIYYYILFFLIFNWYISSMLYNMILFFIRQIERKNYMIRLEPFDPESCNGLVAVKRYLNLFFLMLLILGSYLLVNNLNWYDITSEFSPMAGKADVYIYSFYFLFTALLVTVPTIYFYIKINESKRYHLKLMKNCYFSSSDNLTQLNPPINFEYGKFIYERIEKIDPLIISLRQKWIISIVFSLLPHIMESNIYLKVIKDLSRIF